MPEDPCTEEDIRHCNLPSVRNGSFWRSIWRVTTGEPLHKACDRSVQNYFSTRRKADRRLNRIWHVARAMGELAQTSGTFEMRKQLEQDLITQYKQFVKEKRYCYDLLKRIA